jgi:AAA15 family ATPase/GTPase
MIPGSGQELVDNIADIGKERSLKTVVLYGANASGKTNIVKAFTSAIMMLRQSTNMQMGQLLNWIVPFKMDSKSATKPSSFEFLFETNGTKYLYGFSATDKQIEEEYLYAYYSAKRSKIFERSNINEYIFVADKRELEALAKKNNSNKLFLATATSWNYKKTKEPFLWFAEMIDTFDYRINPDFNAFIHDDTDELRTFVKGLFCVADLNINDYKVEEIDLPKEQIDAMSRDPVLSEILKVVNIHLPSKAVSVAISHSIVKEGKRETYLLKLEEESLGTQKMFFMSTYLKKAFESGKTIIVDELDSSLHPLLIEAIVNMFHNPLINKCNAQLIFITHNVNLLDLDFFRRDQIYFTEKDPATLSSDLYSLDEFKSPVRKSENVRKGYLQGRYGAIPFIGRGETLWG